MEDCVEVMAADMLSASRVLNRFAALDGVSELFDFLVSFGRFHKCFELKFYSNLRIQFKKKTSRCELLLQFPFNPP